MYFFFLKGVLGVLHAAPEDVSRNQGRVIRTHQHIQSGLEATDAVTARDVNQAGGRAELTGDLINSLQQAAADSFSPNSSGHFLFLLYASSRAQLPLWMNHSGYYSIIKAPLMGPLRRK